MKLTPKLITFREEDLEIVLSGDIPTSMGLDQTKFMEGMKKLVRVISDAIKEIKEANNSNEGSAVIVEDATGLPPADISYLGRFYHVAKGAGVADEVYWCRKNAADAYVWTKLPH